MLTYNILNKLLILQNTNEKVYVQGNIKIIESYTKPKDNVIIQEYFHNFQFLISEAKLIIFQLVHQ